ncbi:hypothetical protein ACT3TZ_14525 [Brachybacterium sp. AOP25-B2-12]|uniref:hypothetical protein n=1 Tax=Brachybacterium sp. AOP25-B2-12 TaxID=3457710 RepID=UPI0040349C8B
MPYPGKGDRERLVTRAPSDLARVVTERAAHEGVSVSTYVTTVLARAHSFDLPDYVEREQARTHDRGDQRMSA